MTDDETRPEPPHDLAPELDDLSRAYAESQAENADLRRRLERCMQRGDIAMAERARLRADVLGLRTALEQQQRATEAERAARVLIEQRAELFAGQLDAWGHHEAASQVRHEIIGGPVITENSYAALLAERDAARAVVAAARSSSNYPTFALTDALSAYDEVMKARTE